MAETAAKKRMKTMITAKKVKTWKAKITERLNPKFDGSLNVNILPVSEDRLSGI